MYSHLLEIVDLDINDTVGQTEFGDAIFQYTANLVECLEDMHLKTLLCHIAGEAKTGRTRTDGCHLDTI